MTDKMRIWKIARAFLHLLHGSAFLNIFIYPYIFIYCEAVWLRCAIWFSENLSITCTAVPAKSALVLSLCQASPLRKGNPAHKLSVSNAVLGVFSSTAFGKSAPTYRGACTAWALRAELHHLTEATSTHLLYFCLFAYKRDFHKKTQQVRRAQWILVWQTRISDFYLLNILNTRYWCRYFLEAGDDVLFHSLVARRVQLAL